MSAPFQSVTAVRPPGIGSLVLSVFSEAAQVLKPPPRLKVSDWAEAKRIIPSESGAFTGQYRVSLAPYQRGMMDAVHIPGVEEIVYFTAAQMGKSTCMENIFGYFMEADPSTIIHMWPTEKVAKEWSIDTLDPMLKESPALARLFEAGSRKSANGVLYKKFPGGWLSIIGANAAANLRRRRARILMADEIDAYDVSAEGEGDPIKIVASRSETFWNKLRVMGSTCTIKNESRIEARYSYSNRQKYYVPCPHCSDAKGELDGFQVLQWPRLMFDKTPPHEAHYPCEHCGAALIEADKLWMLRHGRWVAECPEVVHVQGFWLSKLYSPFVKWSELAAKFLDADREVRERQGKDSLQAFVTLDLAETWEEKDEDLDREGLVKRCESYQGIAPDGAIVLTAGVDVQEDRILCEVVGWGKGYPNPESWSVAWRQFDGDTAQPEVWTRLDAFLATEFPHQRGPKLEIAATFIDSGHHANEVYGFTGPRWQRRIFASKGSSDFKHVPLSKMSRNNKQRARMYLVGVSQIKISVYRWLKVIAPGPGYMHFTHAHNDADYFNQLTCEVLKKEYKDGYPVRYWYKPPGARNEALDCRVYAYGAFLSLSENPAGMMERLRESLMDQARKIAEQRKAKVPVGQMALGIEDAAAPTGAPPEAKEAPPQAAIAAAVTTPPPEPPPRPAEPVVIVRRGGWL